MKRLILATLILSAFFFVIGINAAAEENQIKVEVNGRQMGFETNPVIQNGRTLVPVRAIAETFGGQITWKPENEYIIINYGTSTLNVKVGVASYVINGNAYVMDGEPILVHNKVMMPVRFLADFFKADIAWNSSTRTISLTKEGIQLPDIYSAEAHVKEPVYSQEDLLWLARIVNVEGLDISYEAKLAIANVVLNRMKVDIYPNTVYEVIMDDDYTVQFPPAHRESFKSLEPDEESYKAAKDALEGKNNIEDCLYFNNSPFRWKIDDLYTIIDGEYFYR